MSPLFDPSLEDKVVAAGIVAVLIVEDVHDAVPLARALSKGGVSMMELALRTPVALDALRAIRRELPEMVAGVGTILTCDQLTAAHEAGAAFGVAPGCNPRVLGAAREQGFSFAPGVATASDIEVAVEHGCRLVKFFPAEPLGGVPYLRVLATPFAHLRLRYLPLGGLTPATAAAYLREPLVAAIGGSWIAPSELIRARDWKKITARAKAAQRLVLTQRKSHS